MSENIYGGITIPSSPFIFDKYYDNYAAASAAAANDGVMYGRYVMVKYCDAVFDYSTRTTLEDASSAPSDAEQAKYWNNFQKDGKISYDRMVLKKVIVNGKSQYEPVCCLHPINASAYSDEISTAVTKINNLNIKNGNFDSSLYMTNNTVNASHALALGFLSTANGYASTAMGYNTSANYISELVIGAHNLLPYTEEIDSASNLSPVFEIGVAEYPTYLHSGLVVDLTNSILHARYQQQSNNNTVKLIHGWKRTGTVDKAEKTEDDGTTRVWATFAVEGSLERLVDENGNLKYSSCFLVDKYHTIIDEFCTLSLNLEQVAKTVSIAYPKELDTSINNIIGFYIETEKDTAPDILYGTNSIMSGVINYRSLGDCSYAFGNGTLAQGQFSHAEGEQSRAYGHAAHSEGSSNYAVGDYSHAEGKSTAAIGMYSHAEGGYTRAEGVGSLAAGYETTAIGDYSVAMGIGTITKKPYSVAVGQYNTGTCPDAYFEVGTGSKSEPKTGFYVARNGMAYLPQATVANIDTADETALVTKKYLEQFDNYNIEEEGDIEVAQTDFYIPDTDAPTYSYKDTLTWHYEKWKNGKLILTTVANFWNISTKEWGELLETKPLFIKFPYINEFSEQNFTMGVQLQTNSSGDLRPTKYINSSIGVLYSAYETLSGTIVFIPEAGGVQSFWYYLGQPELTTETNQNTWRFALYRPNNIQQDNVRLVLSLKIEAYWKPNSVISDSRYDYNQDGIVDKQDLEILMNILNNQDVEIPEGCITDINGDGVVNNKDYGMLNQIIDGWIPVPD